MGQHRRRDESNGIVTIKVLDLEYQRMENRVVILQFKSVKIYSIEENLEVELMTWAGNGVYFSEIHFIQLRRYR